MAKKLIADEKSFDIIKEILGEKESYLDAQPVSEKEKEDEYDDYLAQTLRQEITFVELAILNSYFHKSYKGKEKDVIIDSYGEATNAGFLEYGGPFEITGSYWFHGKVNGEDNDYIFQTKMFTDQRNELCIHFNITVKNGTRVSDFQELFLKIMKLAFNNSEYKGKCIKIKLREGRFRGIEIIDIATASNDLILNPIQRRYIEHFIKCVGRGGSARYLLNGEAGTGKTESIREIARKLIPNVTFIIPEFTTTDDLTSILEACEIFSNGVIIMDDIDLYLGSRDNGSYTKLLGQFLSFFDGVKKRKISLLASTNDKGLVDKAAERPGRFNFTLDYSFLDAEQIIKVCNIHLPEQWRIQEVYDALNGNVNGKRVNITGAFIANLADNIKEMSEGIDEWGVEDTVSLIIESYKGFYSSQNNKETKQIGFIN